VRIQYATSWFAAGGLLGEPVGMVCNGQQVTDAAGFFRAAAETFFARGQRRTELTFAVQRTFGSLRRAQAFALVHFNDLPNRGDLVVTCGEGADVQAVVLEDAVLDSVTVEELRGSSVRVRYRLLGGAWSTDVTPGEEPDEDVIRRDTVAIAEDATEVAVEFGTPMSGTPTVVASILAPDGADIISCQIEAGSVTASGFTAKLSFPAPSALYELSYIAIA